MAKKATITPLHDRVIVRPAAAETKTAGGIIIPDTAKEKPLEGAVVAVGKGKFTPEGKVTPLEIKAGDKILFGGLDLGRNIVAEWQGVKVGLILHGDLDLFDGQHMLFLDLCDKNRWLQFLAVVAKPGPGYK